ncbi:MAG: hypothetical protein QOK31_1864 [Solirubrobacteraceae bacterium]|nr:hypothetical protein [Solirubrobacteraceae bacterium]
MAEHSRALGVRIGCVTFAIPRLLAAFARDLGRDEIALLGDPERHTYDAFGFERASVARVWLDPRVWRRYATLLARGRRPRAPQGDTLQLGGDVILDAGGRVRAIWRSKGPEDRPTLDELRDALESMRRA